MNYKEAFDAIPKNWLTRAAIVDRYHNEMIQQSRKHSHAETAQYFGMSVGYISEALAIHKYREQVIVAGSRNRAMKIIRALL